MRSAARYNERVSPRIDSPRGEKKPEARDLSHHFMFKHPGDKDGNGMFVLYAETWDELLRMMDDKRHGAPPKPTNTMIPSSPRAHGGYQVDQEPER